MVCPTCSDRVWLWGPGVYTCAHGHKSVEARPDDPVNPDLVAAPEQLVKALERLQATPPPPPPGRDGGWGRFLPYVGGACGVVSLALQVVT